MYAPVATGRPKALVPSGNERNWFTLIPMSNRASASHCSKGKNQFSENTILKDKMKLKCAWTKMKAKEL